MSSASEQNFKHNIVLIHSEPKTPIIYNEQMNKISQDYKNDFHIGLQKHDFHIGLQKPNGWIIFFNQLPILENKTSNTI